MTNFFRRALGPCLGALTIATLTCGADAQPTSAQQSAIRSNCRSDFMANCSGVQPGGKDALMCLQKNVGRLSPGCQTAVRATIPAEPAKTAEPPAAPVPPPAAAAAPPPAAAPSATITSAPPPPAQTAKKPPAKKPATAAVKPALAAPVAPQEVEPEPSGRPGGLAPAAAVVGKACARYIFMHCRGIPPGEGREVACLTNYMNQGNFVGPRCRAALQLSGGLR